MAEKKEYLLTVKVFSYVDPLMLSRADVNATWYAENKIVEYGYNHVVVLQKGYRVVYKLQVYWFRDVKQEGIPALIEMMKANKHKQYRGWLHHYNRYTGITKTFIKPQIIIDYALL